MTFPLYPFFAKQIAPSVGMVIDHPQNDGRFCYRKRVIENILSCHSVRRKRRTLQLSVTLRFWDEHVPPLGVKFASQTMSFNKKVPSALGTRYLEESYCL